MLSSLTLQPLLRRSDFLRIARDGTSVSSPTLVLQGMAHQHNPNTIFLGLTVSRKVGSAVVRNRAKRRLREAARKVLPLAARPGTSYVIIGRKSTATHPFDELIIDLKKTLDVLNQKIK